MAVRVEIICIECNRLISLITGMPEQGVELDKLPTTCPGCGAPLKLPGISGDDPIDEPMFYNHRM